MSLSLGRLELAHIGFGLGLGLGLGEEMYVGIITQSNTHPLRIVSLQSS